MSLHFRCRKSSCDGRDPPCCGCLPVIASGAKQSRAACTVPAALDCFVGPSGLLAMTHVFSRSRDAPSHPSFAYAKVRKPFPISSPKRGRRSADKRTTGVAPLQRAHRFCPATRGIKTAVPSPFGAPPRSCAEGLTLRLGLGRASWNRRVQTGGPSQAPVQRAPRSPVKCRTGRCPEPPGYAVYGRVSENRSRSTFESTLAKGPSVNGMNDVCNRYSDNVKGSSRKKGHRSSD